MGRRRSRAKKQLLRTVVAQCRGHPGSVQDLLALTEATPLRNHGPAISLLFPSAYRPWATICATQEAYFLLRTPNSHAAIRRALAGLDNQLAAPTPAAWREAFRSSGLRVGGVSSAWQLWWRAGQRMVRGTAAALLSLLQATVQSEEAPELTVLQIKPSVLPPEQPEVIPSYDYISCVKRALGLAATSSTHFVTRALPPKQRSDGLSVVCGPLPRPAAAATAGLLGEVCWRSLLAGLLWLCGSWRAALLLPHAVELAHARRLPDEAFARHYVFSVSGWVIRPMWTYRAAEAGARCTIVYYSANSVPYTADHPPRTAHGSGEALASWDRYLMPSEDLAKTLAEQRRAPITVRVEPLLGVEDNGKAFALQRPARCIAVFDVVVFSARQLPYMVRSPEYIVPANASAFFADLLALAEAHDFDIAWKPKRSFQPGTHPAYIKAVERFTDHPRVVAIDPSVSAVRVAAACAATVSFPFTTPSIYGVALNKPSIYYDPTGRMAAHTPRFHGVPVISGKTALADWIAALARQTSPAEPP